MNSKLNTAIKLFFDANLLDILTYKYGTMNINISFDNINKINKSTSTSIYDLFTDKIEHNKFKFISKKLEKKINNQSQIYHLIAIIDKNINITELFNKLTISNSYFININNKYITFPAQKIISNFIDLIAYFNNCICLVTDDYDMKDYALNCGCKEIVFIKKNVKEYTFRYNPFKSKIFIFDSIKSIHQSTNKNFNDIEFINITKGDRMITNKIEKIKCISKSIPTPNLITEIHINNLISISMDTCNNKDIFVNIVRKIVILNNLFNELSNNSDKLYYVISIGNIKLCKNFEDRLLYLLNNILPDTFDLCFLSDIFTQNKPIPYNNDLFKLSDFDMMDSLFVINRKALNKLKFNIIDYSENIIDCYSNYLMQISKSLNTYMLSIPMCHNHNSLLLTGGIGDYFILDYFYNLHLYDTIINISPQCDSIASLQLVCNKNLNIVSINCLKKADQICFLSKDDIMNSNKLSNILKYVVKNSLDFSISHKFIEIRKNYKIDKKINICNQCENYYPYKSSFDQLVLKYTSNFNLPNKYYIIAPTTSWKAFSCSLCNKHHDLSCPVNKNIRNFTFDDWTNTIKFLEKNKIYGVVIGIEDIPNEFKQCKYIVNLTNKTSLSDCILLCINSVGYIGIDTCFSVIASFYLKPDNMFIKCINSHGIINKDIYFYKNRNEILIYDSMQILKTQ